MSNFQIDPNGNTTQQNLSSERQPSESEWTITLEQFLATMISQSLLNDFFSQKPPLLSELEALRQRDRLHSVS